MCLNDFDDMSAAVAFFFFFFFFFFFSRTHRPLAAYSQALTAAGLVIETIREPAKDRAGQPARRSLIS